MAIQWAKRVGPVMNFKDGTKIETWKRVEKFGQLWLNLRKAIFPPNHSLIAYAAVELAGVKGGYLKKQDEGNELLRCAFDIFSISHGRDYAIYWNKNMTKRMADQPVFQHFQGMKKHPFSVKD